MARKKKAAEAPVQSTLITGINVNVSPSAYIKIRWLLAQQIKKELPAFIVKSYQEALDLATNNFQEVLGQNPNLALINPLNTEASSEITAISDITVMPQLEALDRNQVLFVFQDNTFNPFGVEVDSRGVWKLANWEETKKHVYLVTIVAE